jgi:hypothetical protein
VFYVSQRTGAGSWPTLTSILGQGFFVELRTYPLGISKDINPLVSKT